MLTPANPQTRRWHRCGPWRDLARPAVVHVRTQRDRGSRGREPMGVIRPHRRRERTDFHRLGGWAQAPHGRKQAVDAHRAAGVAGRRRKGLARHPVIASGPASAIATPRLMWRPVIWAGAEGACRSRAASPANVMPLLETLPPALYPETGGLFHCPGMEPACRLLRGPNSSPKCHRPCPGPTLPRGRDYSA
jgi:hypothetical protein